MRAKFVEEDIKFISAMDHEEQNQTPPSGHMT